MRRIIIHNIGPLNSVDIEIKRLNVIIGPQSSGKSCVLKIACYCSWVEKRIQISQSATFFQSKGVFVQELERFHKLYGFIREDSYIEYETNTMHFSYSKKTDTFSFQWKADRWSYKRSKISYIPAERNMVAVIPNWYDVKLDDNNIRSFMSDWEEARQAIGDTSVLNLGVDYHYNAYTKKDEVKVSDDRSLDFTNTSSGLQSLIPLYVFLQYFLEKQFLAERKESVSQKSENAGLLKIIYEKLFVEQRKTEAEQLGQEVVDGKRQLTAQIVLAAIGDYLLQFKNDKHVEECKELYENYTKTHSCNIFLEEPEANLFPPTQSQLVDWLQDMTEGEYKSSLFVATHSPYVLTSFLEKTNEDLAIFFIHPTEGEVKTASDDDIQNIYDYGFDAFFNLESLGR